MERMNVALRLLGLYLIGAVAGYGFMRLNLPLPWMIGPMITTAALTITGLSAVVVPVQTRPYGQATVSSQVALFFTPAALQALVLNVPWMIALAVSIMLVAYLVATLMSRLSGMARANALISLLPTSPVEASITAERHGYDPAPVILAQIIRGSAVVIAIPMLLYLIDGAPDLSLRRLDARGDLWGMMLLAGAAALGGLTARKLRIANPFFMGPLVAVSALNVVGLPFDRFPPWVLAVAQILLGTWLGSTFRRELFVSAGSQVVLAVGASLSYVAICALMGTGLSLLGGMPIDTMLLTTAPGGVTEMALTAKVLGANVSLITAFHLTRLFVIVPNISWIVRLVEKRDKSRLGG